MENNTDIQTGTQTGAEGTQEKTLHRTKLTGLCRIDLPGKKARAARNWIKEKLH